MCNQNQHIHRTIFAHSKMCAPKFYICVKIIGLNWLPAMVFIGISIQNLPIYSVPSYIDVRLLHFNKDSLLTYLTFRDKMSACPNSVFIRTLFSELFFWKVTSLLTVI